MDKKNKKKYILLTILIVLIISVVLVLIQFYHTQHTSKNDCIFLTTIGNNKIFKKEITKIEIMHGYDYITTLTNTEDIQTICNYVKPISGHYFAFDDVVTTYVYGINIYTTDGDFLSIGLSPSDFRIRKSYDGDIYFYNSDKIYYDEFNELLKTIIEKKS